MKLNKLMKKKSTYKYLRKIFNRKKIQLSNNVFKMRFKTLKQNLSEVKMSLKMQ